MTLPTVKGAYVLQMLGQEGQFRKALAWLENVSNDDGSLKAIRYQDVYDTALAALALSDNENLDKTISWLEKTKVEGQGFPYYSGGYYPDCDDTSLVLLAKKAAGYEIGDTDEVNFLLKSQNPDRGWSYVSFYSLKYALPYRYLTSLFPKIQNAVRKEGLSLLWHPIFDSAVDMTSRVLITLANTSESVKGRKGAISKGVSYLMRRYHNGSFHGGMRWADSDTYETSLALIALSLSNAGSDVKSGVVSWLLSQRDLGSDELAHIIWACCIAGVRTQDLEQTVRMLVSSQNEDGSWSPRMSFRGSAPYLDPLFSTAMPLLALKTVSARNKEDVPALS